MNRAARIIPDVASFAVDEGFWYSVPDHLRDDVEIGSIVRVPLSGRRVRGWVVEVADGRKGRLKEIAAVSGAIPVFDEGLLDGLVWAARHYVAPVSTLLTRATPPNLPRAFPDRPVLPAFTTRRHGLSELIGRSARGVNTPVTAVVGNWHELRWLESIYPLLVSGRSLLVVAASVAEVTRIARTAETLFGTATVAVDGEDAASDTTAWEAAQSPPRLVIGTPKTATWRIENLGLAIVLEEARRAMKDRQTPTIHVREVMSTRSRIEGFNLAFYGPTPSVETLSAGADVVREGNRAWSLVEVVDRTEDPPGSGVLAARTLAAIKSSVEGGRRVFVFTHRRAGVASTRCTNCRALRVCRRCGWRLGRVDRCPKCDTAAGACTSCGEAEFEEMGTIPDRLVAELDRRVGRGLAAVHPGDAAVTVGTERDLAGLERVDLAVAVDVDGMLTGVGYRTSEEALRQLARLASVVGPGHGSRLMLQTSHPDSMLITTLRRGDPVPYLERVLVDRAREEAPPSTEMIAVEIRGRVPESAGNDLTGLEGDVVVLGPMAIDEGARWLLTGRLGKARLGLRKVVGRWRDQGATVRVDVDPIDV